MKINSTSELLDYYNKYCCLENQLIDEENELLELLDNCGLYSFKRKEFKCLVKQKRYEIIDANVRKKYCYEMFTNYTTFSSEILLPFITEYLTHKEKEEYVLIGEIKEEDSIFNFFNNYYDIVTTIENKKKIEERCPYLKTEDIHELLSVIKDNKYICIESDDQYSLLNGPELSLEFSKYEYLKDLAYTLLDIKLTNPSITDEEILKEVLGKSRVKSL